MPGRSGRMMGSTSTRDEKSAGTSSAARYDVHPPNECPVATNVRPWKPNCLREAATVSGSRARCVGSASAGAYGEEGR